jgi:hypothetical protein
MKITQTFRSADDELDISTMEINGSSSTPIRAVGDHVEWIDKDHTYFGSVSSRLISYGTPESSVGRDDDFDIHVILNVEVEENSD